MLISKKKIIISLFFLINYNYGMENLEVYNSNNQELKKFEYKDFENILREKCKDIKTKPLNIFERNKNLEGVIIHENGHLNLNIIGNYFAVKNTERYIENKKNILDEKTNNKLKAELNKINNKIKISQDINSKIVIEANIESNKISCNSLINFNSNISGMVSENKYFKNEFNYLNGNEKGNDLNNSWKNLNEIFNDIDKKREQEKKEKLIIKEKKEITEALIDENIKLVESEKYKELIKEELTCFKNFYSNEIKNIIGSDKNEYKDENKKFNLKRDGNNIITEINYNNKSNEELFELFKNNINENNKLLGFGINLNINGFYDNLLCIQKAIILLKYKEKCEINRKEYNEKCEINRKEFNKKCEINIEEYNKKFKTIIEEINEFKKYNEKCKENEKEYNKKCEINRKLLN